jgi:cytochrome c2
MNDLQDRTLLAIADARLRIGLAFFSCAMILTAFGLLSDAHKSEAHVMRCGLVGEPYRPPAGLAGAALSEYQRGEKLFKTNCASCHKPDQKLTGPQLKGAKDRWAEHDGDIYAWVKNSMGYLKNKRGDAYAHALFQQYNGAVMTPNAVTNEEIDAILSYADNFRPRYYPAP